MARWISLMAVFFLSMSLISGVIMGGPIGDMLGLQTEVGGDQKVDQATEEAGSISSGAPTGSTLFGMYNVLAGGLSTLTAPVTLGPTFFHRMGAPGWITFDILQPIIAVTYALGIMSFLRGWGL